MDNVTLRSLEKTHPGQASELFEKIRVIGGFGDVDPNHEGGLDIKGLPEAAQKRIAALLAKTEDAAAEETPEEKSKKGGTK